MPLSTQELLARIACGEDSSRQFKADIHNGEALAAEMAAFANADGGTIFVGVADDGTVQGLSGADVHRINQIISNAASQMVRSPLVVQTENIPVGDNQVVIALHVPKGLDKPYFDKNGVIWLKVGADKRRVNSKEELRRLFQLSGQFHADEMPTKAGPDKLDKLLFRDFLQQSYGLDYPDTKNALTHLLQNLNLATESGCLNLAGLLLFAEHPEWIAPQFVVKAISFPGTDIHTSDYTDSEDFCGPLPRMFQESFAFVLRNLSKIQARRSVNAPGHRAAGGHARL